MRNFVWISFVVLFSTCSYPLRQKLKAIEHQTLSGQEWKPLFKQSEQLFRTQIDFKDRHFSGLMAVKSTEMGYRFGFFTEVGMTMFDLEVGAADFNLHYCFEPMNRPALIKLLVKDFRRLSIYGMSIPAKIFQDKEDNKHYKLEIEGEKNYYKVDGLSQQLVSIFHPSLFPDQASVGIVYRDAKLQQIEIRHKKIGLSIELKPL